MTKRQNPNNEVAQSTSQNSNNQLTLVVFKDHFPARSLKIPLHWFSWFGGLIFVILLTFLVSIYFVVKSFRLPAPSISTGSTGGPETVVTATITATVTTTATVAPTSPVPGAPAPTTAAPVMHSDSNFFEGVTTLEPMNPPRVAIKNFQYRWSGAGGGSWKRLVAQFDIIFVSKDPGPQNGRIVVLAKGPDALLTYPAGLLSIKDGANFPLSINFQTAETFSVSRLRQVKADFTQGGLSPKSITQVDAYLFDSEKRVLAFESFKLKSLPASQSAPEPAPESSRPAALVPPAAATTATPALTPAQQPAAPAATASPPTHDTSTTPPGN